MRFKGKNCNHRIDTSRIRKFGTAKVIDPFWKLNPGEPKENNFVWDWSEDMPDDWMFIIWQLVPDEEEWDGHPEDGRWDLREYDNIIPFSSGRRGSG